MKGKKRKEGKVGEIFTNDKIEKKRQLKEQVALAVSFTESDRPTSGGLIQQLLKTVKKIYRKLFLNVFLLLFSPLCSPSLVSPLLDCFHIVIVRHIGFAVISTRCQNDIECR